MSSAVRQDELLEIPEIEPRLPGKVMAFMPVIIPILLAGIIIFARYKFGPSTFLYEGTLTMLDRKSVV